MRPALLLVDHHDPRGRHGLGADLLAAEALGAEPLPVPTGFTGGAGEPPAWLRPVGLRTFDALLGAALEARPAAALVGLVGRRRHVRLLARRLAGAEPLVLVLAPLTLAFDARPLLPRRLLASVRRRLLPDSTVLAVPARQLAALLPGTGEGVGELKEAGRRLLAEGAQGVWIMGSVQRDRGLDVVVDRRGAGLLDYPLPGAGAVPHAGPAALAALLARGLPLREAVDRAHRHAQRLEGAPHAATG